jgi:ubiquinone/menaquinone biosynthesis C-methylase UbiE
MMEKHLLIEHLREIDKISNETWLMQLEDRKMKELEFHNRDRDKEFVEKLNSDTYEKIYGNRKFYRTVNLSTEFVENWIRDNAKGKVFLDYACGNGFNAIKAAKAGCDLAIGIDISDVSVINARVTATENGLGEDQVFFVQADAERTGLPDNSIDLVICSGMLHHLDLSYAFWELRRILKPGGKVLAIEALDYNPFIKLYRMVTPDMRTEWEKAHILFYKDLRFAKRFFAVKNIRHWHFMSIFAAFAPFLLRPFNAIDKIFMHVPIVNRLSWMFTFELIKR